MRNGFENIANDHEIRQPQVSVVINNYNYGRFLSAAIDSALGQSYPNVEVIVVDDGSTDDSRQVIERYGARITGIFKENGGQASAMNRGYEAARGELIYFLDADDSALPECLHTVVNRYVQAGKPLALLNFRICLMDAKGNSLDRFYPPAEVALPGENVSALIRQKGTYRHQPTSANVFTAGALKKIMPIPEEDFRICAETYLCYHAPLFGGVAGINEVLAHYRVHHSNNYHQPKKVYDSSGIIEYIEKQQLFYAAIVKSRRRFVEDKNLKIGGNANLLHLIFKYAQRRMTGKQKNTNELSEQTPTCNGLWNEINGNEALSSSKQKAAVLLYLLMIALLPRRLVLSLIRITFIDSPKMLGFFIRKSFSN